MYYVGFTLLCIFTNCSVDTFVLGVSILFAGSIISEAINNRKK